MRVEQVGEGKKGHEKVQAARHSDEYSTAQIQISRVLS